jgi:hypothetical protein
VEADRIEDGSGSNLNADQLDGRGSGAYLPGDLPAGTTVYGVFLMQDHATGVHRYEDAVSFGYRLPFSPTMHYIKYGEAVPGGCFGDVENPGADPGHVCFFERTTLNVTSNRGTISAVNHPLDWRAGAGLYMNTQTSGQAYILGTWAVTGA